MADVVSYAPEHIIKLVRSLHGAPICRTCGCDSGSTCTHSFKDMTFTIVDGSDTYSDDDTLELLQ